MSEKKLSDAEQSCQFGENLIIILLKYAKTNLLNDLNFNKVILYSLPEAIVIV